MSMIINIDILKRANILNKYININYYLINNMGQNQSSELNKFQLSFLIKRENNYVNIKPYKITKALNMYYVYFHIKDYCLNHIINSDVELYISNIADISSNQITEDVLKTKIKNTTISNLIEKKQYYDIIQVTEKSKKVIFRSSNVSAKSFDIVYVL